MQTPKDKIAPAKSRAAKRSTLRHLLVLLAVSLLGLLLLFVLSTRVRMVEQS